MAHSSSRFSITLPLICGLLFAFTATAGAKPRKKSKKARQSAAQIKREIAAQWALLTQSVAATKSPGDGGFGTNSGRDTSVRPAASQASAPASVPASGNAQYVADPEARNPDVHPAAALAGQIIISEFRLQGPNGVNDEFIEIYNASGANHTVADSGAGTGYAVVASDGVTRCVIPNGLFLPNRGHFLCTNSNGYSLFTYPSGDSLTATGDATYTADIPLNSGIAIFNTSVAANFTLANRLDAAGSTSEANPLYKEGTGYPPVNAAFNIEDSFYRDMCGKSGSIATFGQCTVETPRDTDNNAVDFVFVDTNGTSIGAGQRLGAPNPENQSAPIQNNASIPGVLLDTCVGDASPPNRVRDFTVSPNGTFGTIDIRRTFTNNTGLPITKLRFHIVDLTTFPAPAGVADLRPRTSTAVVVTVDRPPCGVGTSNITVQGTTLETPPAQPNGGGFGSTLAVGTVTFVTPLNPGQTVDLRFLLGIQQTGNFRLYVNVEAQTS